MAVDPLLLDMFPDTYDLHRFAGEDRNGVKQYVDELARPCKITQKQVKLGKSPSGDDVVSKATITDPEFINPPPDARSQVTIPAKFGISRADILEVKQNTGFIETAQEDHHTVIFV